MPPAMSDSEPSDSEHRASVRRSGKKAQKHSEPLEEDFDEPEAQNGDVAEEDEEDEEDDGEEEAEVYVVEKILSHMIGKDGEPLFEVKWEGYEKKADRTWEPEDNLLVNASEILNEYLKSVGGREALLNETQTALKSKKRGRKDSSTPQSSTTSKRSKRNSSHPLDSEPPASAKQTAWKPPAGSWEDHIAQLDACEDEETHKLMVYLTWKNGHKTQHETSVIYSRCPQKMLQFYERHVRIIKKEETPVDSPPASS
ncbi:putative heterochromatin factor HP1 [Triangularia verruculosa]|uniref:Heterochromatin factor HP1 n=1 Tax=Triangularia verruculosa TaxID=2587418 RepID=A0AAN7AWL3_9PEZI|nr:putative heterochromatin factor HP1 [Triangularia verruculosa]